MTTVARGGALVTLSVSGNEITRPVAAADALFALLSLPHLFVLWISRWKIRWCARRRHEVAVAEQGMFTTRRTSTEHFHAVLMDARTTLATVNRSETIGLAKELQNQSLIFT